MRTYKYIFENKFKQFVADIFFVDLKHRDNKYFKLDPKHFKKYWHTGIIYNGKVYETFPNKKYAITKRYDNKRYDIIHDVIINISKLKKGITKGFDCASYVAYCLDISNYKDYYPDDIYIYLQKQKNNY